MTGVTAVWGAFGSRLPRKIAADNAALSGTNSPLSAKSSAPFHLITTVNTPPCRNSTLEKNKKFFHGNFMLTPSRRSNCICPGASGLTLFMEPGASIFPLIYAGTGVTRVTPDANQEPFHMKYFLACLRSPLIG